MAQHKSKLWQYLVRHLRAWHRKLGLAGAIIILFLTISGVSINHSNDFGFDSNQVRANWILDWYNIANPINIKAIAKQQNLLVATDQYLWLNQTLLVKTEQPIIQLHHWQNTWLALTASSLYWFDNQGNLVEQFDASVGLPNQLKQLCSTNQQLFVGNQQTWVVTDANMLDWQVVDSIPEHCEKPRYTQLINSNKQFYQNAFRSQFLSQEKLLIDLHSWRFFGKLGPWLLDFIAIIILLLAVSGLVIWMRYQQAKR